MQRKKPLRSYKKLEQKTTLKAYKSLQAKTGLQQKTPLQSKAVLKSKQKTAKKLKEPYKSIFTDDLSKCYITGDTNNVHPHHIFSGGRKTLSEIYGFIIPLRADWHTLADYSVHKDRELDLQLKRECREYYINVLGKSEEEWLAEFGKNWANEQKKIS